MRTTSGSGFCTGSPENDLPAGKVKGENGAAASFAAHRNAPLPPRLRDKECKACETQAADAPLLFVMCRIQGRPGAEPADSRGGRLLRNENGRKPRREVGWGDPDGADTLKGRCWNPSLQAAGGIMTR